MTPVHIPRKERPYRESEFPWGVVAIVVIITVFVLILAGAIPVPADPDCHSNSPVAC